MKLHRGRPHKVVAPPCVHYWMVNELNVGTCKRCGQVKDFSAFPLIRGPMPGMNMERRGL